MKEHSIPVRVICNAFSIARATLYRFLASQIREDPLVERITQLAYEHPQYGYRRIWALLKKEGIVVNQKKGLSDLYPALSPEGGETFKENTFSCPCVFDTTTIHRPRVVC